LVGTILTIASPTIAQIVGQSAAELIMIDMEHAPQPIDTVTSMVHTFNASSRGRGLPLIRVPSHGVEWIKWALDSGASGIIVPMVNDVAEARAVLDRAVYPPGGRRSFGPIYAAYAHPAGVEESGGQAGYFARAQRGDVAILPMIESKEGLANAEAILALPGVTGVLVGPADLRLSLGMTAAIDGPEAEFQAALESIVAAGRKAGKLVGTVALGEEAIARRAKQGFDFVLTGFDMGALVVGLNTELAAAKKSVEAGVARG
ncbi:Pyruvate/Phosphoenolpyruvate kinase-like domain-containing protein, partial [Neohortaea acidophila]